MRETELFVEIYNSFWVVGSIAQRVANDEAMEWVKEGTVNLHWRGGRGKFFH